MIKREAGDAVTPATRHEADKAVDRQKRYAQILDILGTRMMTAKEIAVEMRKRGYTDSDDQNNAAPRLTEMSHKGIVEPAGKKICNYTGKLVAVYARREA